VRFCLFSCRFQGMSHTQSTRLKAAARSILGPGFLTYPWAKPGSNTPVGVLRMPPQISFPSGPDRPCRIRPWLWPITITRQSWGRDIISTLRSYGHAGWARHSFKSTSREGGFSERVLQTAINDGFVCSEASFPSQFGDGGRSSMDAYVRLLDGVEAAHEDFGDIDPEKLAQDSSCSGKLSRQVTAAKVLFPRLDLEELVKVARRSEPETFLYELSRWGCDAIPLRGELAGVIGRPTHPLESSLHPESTWCRSGLEAVCWCWDLFS